MVTPIHSSNNIPKPPPPPTKKRSPGYKIPGFRQLIKNLPEDEKQAILRTKVKPQEISDTEDIMSQRTILIGDTAPKISRVALASLRDGKISISRAATIHMVLAAHQELILEPKTSIHYGAISQNAVKTLTIPLASLPFYEELPKEIYQSHFEDAEKLLKFFQFTSFEWGEFKRLMREEDDDEQYFFKIQIPSLGSWSPLYDRLCELITCFRPYPQGDAFDLAKGRWLVIPSFTMVQHFINIKAKSYGRKPLELVPVLGAYTADEIGAMKAVNQTIFGLWSPELIKINREARVNSVFMDVIDSWKGSGQASFWIHDLYHAIRELQMSDGQSLARIRSIFVLRTEKCTKWSEQIKRTIMDKLIDGELMFAHNPSKNLFVKGASNESFGRIFHTTTLQNEWNHEFTMAVIRDMVVNKDAWEQEFGINKHDLDYSEKALYTDLEAIQEVEEMNAQKRKKVAPAPPKKRHKVKHGTI